MEEELLKELDSILQPAIAKSWADAKRNAYGNDPRDAFLDLLKVQLDNTKVDISNTLQKLDLAMQGNSCSVETAAQDFEFPENVEDGLPEVDSNEYVKETSDGFEVWDGMRWMQVSKQASIKVDVFEDPDNDNRPAVRVWAKDPVTETSILFVDNDIVSSGYDLSMTRTGDFDYYHDIPKSNGGYWEDPMYNISKNSMGIGGMVSGVLEINQLVNLTPWRTGDALKNANGWYRTKEGLLRNLNKQRGGFATGVGGHQKGANAAFKRSKIFNRIGKIAFGASVAYSVYGAAEALQSDDSNKHEVYAKATVDIVIGAIGVWGGPVGWVISGTYLILDISGVFGDWGKPSGMSMSENSLRNKMLFDQKYGFLMKDMNFEIEYQPTMEEEKKYYLEERTVKQDNTGVARKKVL
ncbi:hypothetical protein, partial [Maribacter luteus]|uniref:hypothetical protein n=1 Tax=Maribacter luteus TaxID=2594478 RepID=UPI002490DECE